MNVHVVTVLSPTDPELLMTKVFTSLDDAKDYVVKIAKTIYAKEFQSFNDFINWSVVKATSDSDEMLFESGDIVLLENVQLVVDQELASRATEKI